MSTAELLAKRRKADRGIPRLWVRRFVLFERLGKELSSSSIIRDLTLERGLNIIQGLEASTNGTEKKQPRGLTGHSVGKTLFCRLLRHGLGEHRYGTVDQKARIQNTFPEGWLGLEAELDGEPWAILRKIGKGEISYSATGIGLADLVPSLGRQEYQGLQAWWDALGRKLSSGIQGFDPVSTSDWMMQQWLKLLSWCARDQEARFRKTWQWRSKDSASDSPRILMNEAQRIIRGTLGLLNTDDAKTEMEYLRLKQRKDVLKLEIESLSQEPAFRLRLHDEWLNRVLKKAFFPKNLSGNFIAGG